MMTAIIEWNLVLLFVAGVFEAFDREYIVPGWKVHKRG